MAFTAVAYSASGGSGTEDKAPPKTTTLPPVKAPAVEKPYSYELEKLPGHYIKGPFIINKESGKVVGEVNERCNIVFYNSDKDPEVF